MTEEETSFEDAAAVGFKVIEIAEKVALGDKFAVGAQGVWHFSIDDRRFRVVITNAEPLAPDEQRHG